MSYPTNFVKVITPIALAISLAACGGGDSFGNKSGSSSGSSSGTTTTSTSNPDGVAASSIHLSANSRRLDSSGSEPVVLSVVAKDANNVVLPDAAVLFSVNNGASLILNATTTGTQGAVHTANLLPGSKENRTVTVTAKSGGITQTIDIDIVGTQLKVQGPESIAINKATEYVIQLQDSSEKPVDGTITLKSALGNTITPSTGTTDSNGEFRFTLTGTAGGADTITATSLGATATKSVNISGNDFTVASSSEEININGSETITLKWLQNNAPKAGELISLRTTRGTLSVTSVTTDGSGNASFSISSTTAGSATITAETSSGLLATLDREFIATVPSYLNTQAAPTVIGPNKTSRIIARVRDANDNPVKNIKVNYNVNDTINGTLKSGQATTDSLGRAEVVYQAGDSTSGYEGVTIQTTLKDFTTITDAVKLTVGGDALRIVLGSDEKIIERDVRYIKTFVVIVTDSAGNPVPNKEVDFTIAAQSYIKGYMQLVDTNTPPDGKPDEWVYVPTITCPIEDADQDGQLDNGEDINGNGTLEPTQDATITTAGKTNAEGSMTVEVIYPQSSALWSTQLITAKTTVNGTEFVENTIFNMSMLAADMGNEDVSPPNARSPYGVVASCTNPN